LIIFTVFPDFSIASIISFLFFSATVVVYAYFKELKTTPGRSFLFLASSLWLINASFTVINGRFNILPRELIFLALTTVSLGYLLVFLWSCVLSFDIWWTFKKFRTPTDDNSRLMFYFMHVFGVTALIIFTTYFGSFLPIFGAYKEFFFTSSVYLSSFLQYLMFCFSF